MAEVRYYIHSVDVLLLWPTLQNEEHGELEELAMPQGRVGQRSRELRQREQGTQGTQAVKGTELQRCTAVPLGRDG